jgi:hypothetical protein
MTIEINEINPDDIIANLHEEIRGLELKLEKIAKHPDTPPLLKQYALGLLDIR